MQVKKLPGGVMKKWHVIKNYSHLDFIWGEHSDKNINEKIFSVLPNVM